MNRELTLEQLSYFTELRMHKEPDFQPIECNRCGKCCEAFPLPYSPEEIEIFYRKLYQGTDHSVAGKAIFAAWWPDLESIPMPDEYKAKLAGEVKANNSHWYRCKNHIKEEQPDGSTLSSCKIHEYRPHTCSRFAPHFQGGYLHHLEQIPYDECSYKTEWAAMLEELKNEVIHSPQSVKDFLQQKQDEQNQAQKEIDAKVADFASTLRCAVESVAVKA